MSINLIFRKNCLDDGVQHNWQLIYFSIPDQTTRATLTEKKYRPNPNAKSYFLGYSFEVGLNVQEVINAKFGIYHILNIKKYGSQFPYIKLAFDRSFEWMKPAK